MFQTKLQNNRMALAKGTTKALTSRTFEAQSHGFRTRCGHRAELGRLRHARYLTQRKIRFRPLRAPCAAGSALPDGFSTRRVTIEGFKFTSC